MSLKDKVFQDHTEVELRSGSTYIICGNKMVGVDAFNNVFDLKYNEDLRHLNSEGLDIMKAINPFTNEVIYERDEINYDRLIEDTTKKLHIPINNKVILMSEDVIKYLEEPKLSYPTKRDGFVAKYRGVEAVKVEGKGVMRVLYEIL